MLKKIWFKHKEVKFKNQWKQRSFLVMAITLVAAFFVFPTVASADPLDLAIEQDRNSSQPSWTGGVIGAVDDSSISSNVNILSMPVNSVLPVIFGDPEIGTQLACWPGEWENNPTTYEYAWLRDGVEVPLATDLVSMLVARDGNSAITCRVTATSAS